MKLTRKVLIMCLLAGASRFAYAQAGTAPAPSPQSPPAPVTLKSKVSETQIDSGLAEDEATKAALTPYVAKVRELSQPIGKLTEDIQKFGMGGGMIGNFVADAMRSRGAAKLGQPVILAITNSGGLRKNAIKAGDISTSDIFELLPFENALVTVDLTGEQLRRFLDVIVARRDAQSGARILYRTDDQKKNVISSVRLGDNDRVAADIKPDATYTIVTIDYLVNRGGDYAMLKEGKNIKPLGLTLRDAVIEYVKAETAAGRAIRSVRDGRFRFDRSNSAPNAEGDKDPND